MYDTRTMEFVMVQWIALKGHAESLVCFSKSNTFNFTSVCIFLVNIFLHTYYLSLVTVKIMTSSSLMFSLFSIYLTEKGFLRQCYMFWECLYPTRSAHFPPLPGSSIRIPFPICFVESCDGEFVTRVVTMWPLSSSSTLSRMTTRSGGRVWEVEPSSRSRATGRLLTSSLPDVTLRVVSTTSVGIT